MLAVLSIRFYVLGTIIMIYYFTELIEVCYWSLSGIMLRDKYLQDFFF